jgi:hypothetical protein
MREDGPRQQEKQGGNQPGWSLHDRQW